MPSASSDVLEFQALKEILVQFIDSPAGVRLVEQLAPMTDRSVIQGQIELIRECWDLIETGQGLRFQYLGDSTSIFERLHISGASLEPKEILQVLQIASCAQFTKRILQIASVGHPRLAAIERELPSLSRLSSVLNGKINQAGEVEDHASPALKRIRQQLNVIRTRVYRSLTDIFQKHHETQVIQDDVITLRNDRYVIPVRIEKRKDLAGVVHATSSSGSTIFVEPLASIELNNQIVRLREQAEEETRRILFLLTEEVRTSLADLELVTGLLAILDLAFGFVRFGQKFGCTLPRVNEEDTFEIIDGRHPVLERSLSGQNRKIVPMSVSLDRSRHILVISGPNTGGKTIALKTMGLLAMMSLSGVPVPAASADICVFSQIFADIGDRQSIAENLSTFSSHLINIKGILENVTAPALVLLDELGTGTDPAEGSALGVAIVEELRRKGITAVVTTHHNGLKMYASRTAQVSNASVEFDEATLCPTYRLLHGIPGSSSGLEIARRLGLEEQLLEHAQRLISEEEREIGRYSTQLRQQIEAAALDQDKLRYELRRLVEQRGSLEDEYKSLLETKRRELEQRWGQVFASFEEETRLLLAEIKDKYLGVRARRDIERRASQLRQMASKSMESIVTHSESIPTAEPAILSPFHPGAKVRVKRFGQTGVLIASHKEDLWEVSIGSMKCSLNTAELEPIPGEPIEAGEHLRSTSHITVKLSTPELQSNEINLIGCSVEEALGRADKFLDQAYLASVPSVRLIHGFGMGVLRKAISKWLSAQPYVSDFHAASPGEGGNAVTVVSLKN